MLSVRFAKKLSQLLLHGHEPHGPSTTGSTRNFKVAVVGASGGIGQPLSLLLKQAPLIETLVLCDLKHTRGVAADLSHICTNTAVKHYNGQLECALKDMDVVVVPAGMPRKPGMTRDQLLEANADVAKNVALAVGGACPNALLAFVTNPINIVVPIAAEFLKAKESYNPKRLFGVTTLDVLRAQTFIGELMNVEPKKINIPVIGGHAGKTILPLFSQCKPSFTGDAAAREELTRRIQEAGTEVVKAKAGKGSATLSMAYAAAHFVNALLRALKGEKNIIECAYVESEVSHAEFISTPLLLGPQGIEQNLGLPQLDDLEKKAFDHLVPILNKNIQAAKKFAENNMC